MYKQYKNWNNQIVTDAIIRTSDGAFIPFAPANTDYANFKKKILADEAQLQDSEGDIMSAAEAKAYVATLP